MLPPRNKIPKNDIPPLVKGRYISLGAVEFRAMRSKKPNSRIACIPSKRSIPKAVDRHTFKRLIYCAFLGYPAQGNPHDIIIRPGRGWKENTPTKASVKDSVLQILKSLNI